VYVLRGYHDVQKIKSPAQVDFESNSRPSRSKLIEEIERNVQKGKYDIVKRSSSHGKYVSK